MSAFSEAPIRQIEQEAIAAYLNTLDPEQPAAKILVIEQTTATADEAFVATDPQRERLVKDLPQATGKVIDDFLRVSATPSELRVPGQLVRRNVRLQMVRKKDMDRLFDLGKPSLAWARFYELYPDAAGLVQISRVGIDESAAQALFYMSIRQGGLRGSGHFVLLHRPFGIWRVLATAKAWIS